MQTKHIKIGGKSFRKSIILLPVLNANASKIAKHIESTPKAA